MRKEGMPEKMPYTKMEGKLPREGPRTRWRDQSRLDVEMKGEN